MPRVPVNIRIPSELLEALKGRAAAEGTTVTDLLVRGARALLDVPAAKPKPSTLEERVRDLEERLEEIERKDATGSA
ncbi:MAG: hypothetical protein VKI63_09590 [Cyanobium sp.]|nr:hypothetical protein [Cyanobium sp.]